MNQLCSMTPECDALLEKIDDKLGDNVYYALVGYEEGGDGLIGITIQTIVPFSKNTKEEAVKFINPKYKVTMLVYGKGIEDIDEEMDNFRDLPFFLYHGKIKDGIGKVFALSDFHRKIDIIKERKETKINVKPVITSCDLEALGLEKELPDGTVEVDTANVAKLFDIDLDPKFVAFIDKVAAANKKEQPKSVQAIKKEEEKNKKSDNKESK